MKITLALILTWSWGLLGLAFATLLAQLFTNHWFMLARGLSRLEVGLKEHLIGNFLPAIVALIVVFVSISWARLLLKEQREIVIVVTGLSLSGIVLVFSIWITIVNPSAFANLLWSRFSKKADLSQAN